MSAQPQPEVMLQQKAENAGLEIPPKVFLDMEGEMLEYIEGKSLRVRFPVKERYQNPLGYMQGGMIVAAMDNTIGPLSYLVAPPSVTTQLNTSYIRPVTPQDAYIEVVAILVERTRRQIFLSAEAMNPAGKRVATCTATCMLIGE
ncbi:MAG: PaaI family thioesterase [bacterium]|nr:PaaI family thioesterase [bacterium]